MIVSKLRSKLIKTALYRMRRSQYEQFLDLYVDGFRVIVCVFFQTFSLHFCVLLR